jgi:hypothetical protein
MAEGRGRSEWSRTGSLMAHISNIISGGKAKATANDFSPFAPEEPVMRLSSKQSIEALKMVLGHGKQ